MSADEIFWRLDRIIEGQKTYIESIKETTNKAAAERLRAKAEKFLYEENGRIIISAYYLLNNIGQEESVKRIVELTEIPKYQIADFAETESPPEGQQSPTDGTRGNEND